MDKTVRLSIESQTMLIDASSKQEEGWTRSFETLLRALTNIICSQKKEKNQVDDSEKKKMSKIIGSKGDT